VDYMHQQSGAAGHEAALHLPTTRSSLVVQVEREVDREVMAVDEVYNLVSEEMDFCSSHYLVKSNVHSCNVD